MYILASVFFEKDKNTYSKLEIRVVCREFFFAFKYVVIVFFETKQMIIYICTSWKLAYKTGFSVHNIHLYLCWQVEDTKWILCYRKIGVKCAYLRFLMYKVNFTLLVIKSKTRSYHNFKSLTYYYRSSP
jgi:hypothetical protein